MPVVTPSHLRGEIINDVAFDSLYEQSFKFGLLLKDLTIYDLSACRGDNPLA